MARERDGVLITGANGFIGRNLCGFLDRHGYRVLAAVRRQRAEMPRLKNGRVVVAGDLTEPTDTLLAALGECRAVVHLAAIAHVTADKDQQPDAVYEKINAAATAHLAQRAAEHGVARFVFLSSIGVNGCRTTGERKFTEDDPPAPCEPYAVAKRNGEEALRAVGALTGMEHVILRAPLVYGPGCVGNLPRLMRLITAGNPLPFGAVRNVRSFVYIDNLCSAIEDCLEAPAAANQLFLVCDRETVSTPELIGKLAASMHVRPRLLPVPLPLLQVLATLAGKRKELAKLTDSLAIDNSRITSRLGWKPEVSLDHRPRENCGGFFGPEMNTKRGEEK